MSHFGRLNNPHPKARCPVCGVTKLIADPFCSPLCHSIQTEKDLEARRDASKTLEDARCDPEEVNEGEELETRLEAAYEVAKREEMDAAEQGREQLRDWREKHGDDEKFCRD